MKFIISILTTAILALLLGLYLPWWSIALAGFIMAILMKQSSGKSFLAGFLGVFLFWGVFAFLQDMNNQHILSAKISALLSMGNNSFLLIVITGVVGGLVAGFAALTASSFYKNPKVTKNI